jgi:hypothetical protein
MKKLIIAGIGILALAGCSSKYTEPFKDAPRTQESNNDPAQVIRMPDGFSNLSSKCDGPNRVYVIYHGDNAYGSIAVAANDPRCKSS